MGFLSKNLLFTGTLLVALTGALPLAGQVRNVQTLVTVPSGSFIGVGIQEINSDRAKTLKLPEEAGVEITRVDSDSPAEKAGLKTGDVVLQFNGQKVEGIEQFSRQVRETPAGREVKLEIFRNGAPQTVAVKVGQRTLPRVTQPLIQPSLPGGLGRLPDVPRSFLSWRSPMLGVEAESLDGQLADYFGVKEGVLVRSVLKGSAAEKAGIKAGDVITRVDDSKIATPADISSRLRSVQGKTVPVALMRDRKEVSVSVTVETDSQPETPFRKNLLTGPARIVNVIQQ